METHVVERIQRYLRGDIDGQEKAYIEEHIGTCENCYDAYQDSVIRKEVRSIFIQRKGEGRCYAYQRLLEAAREDWKIEKGFKNAIQHPKQERSDIAFHLLGCEICSITYFECLERVKQSSKEAKWKEWSLKAYIAKIFTGLVSVTAPATLTAGLSFFASSLPAPGVALLKLLLKAFFAFGSNGGYQTIQVGREDNEAISFSLSEKEIAIKEVGGFQPEIRVLLGKKEIQGKREGDGAWSFSVDLKGIFLAPAMEKQIVLASKFISQLNLLIIRIDAREDSSQASGKKHNV